MALGGFSRISSWKMILLHFPKWCIRSHLPRMLVREALGQGPVGLIAVVTEVSSFSVFMWGRVRYTGSDFFSQFRHGPWRVVMASFFLLQSLDPGGIEQSFTGSQSWRWESFKKAGRVWGDPQSTSPFSCWKLLPGKLLWLSLLVAGEGGNDLLVKPLPQHPRDRPSPPTPHSSLQGFWSPAYCVPDPLFSLLFLLQAPRLIWDSGFSEQR